MFARGIVEISVFSDATNVDFQRKVKKIKLSHSDLKYEKNPTSFKEGEREEHGIPPISPV